MTPQWRAEAEQRALERRVRETRAPFLTIRETRAHSRLRVPGALVIESAAPRPNAWRRFWHWALLGWTWEKL